MIDSALLMFSIGMVVFVCWRAVLLDRKLPWFPPLAQPDQDGPAPAGSDPQAKPAAKWRERPRSKRAPA